MMHNHGSVKVCYITFTAFQGGSQTTSTGASIAKGAKTTQEQGDAKSGINVGDIVLCTAARNKAKWDNKEGRVLAVLTSTYKVQILSDGPSKNETHKYEFGHVHKKGATDADGGDEPAAKIQKVTEDPNLFDASDLETTGADGGDGTAAKEQKDLFDASDLENANTD